MYWLNLTGLKDELKRGPMGQPHAFQYALADALLTTLARGSGAPWWQVLAVAAITGLGTAYCYEANGGADGTDFIARYVSLGWVVGLRVALACILPIGLAVAVAVKLAPESELTVKAAVTLLAVAAIYWRMGAHFADIRRHTAPAMV
jgi:hypothetical protein